MSLGHCIIWKGKVGSGKRRHCEGVMKVRSRASAIELSGSFFILQSPPLLADYIKSRIRMPLTFEYPLVFTYSFFSTVYVFW